MQGRRIARRLTTIAGIAIGALLSFCPPLMAGSPNRHDLREISKTEIISEIRRIPQWKRRQEVLCLSLVVYHEARGSTQADMYGVANVVVNRAEHDGFPNNICSVIYQKHQFSWTRNRGRKIAEQDAWKVSQRIAYLTYMNKDRYDRTNGSVHFYNPGKIKKPKWAKNAKRVKKIGNHLYISKL